MDKMVFKLRSMAFSDVDSIIEVHKKSIYGLCKNFYSEEQMKVWTSMFNHKIFNEGIKNVHNLGVVALHNDTIVGYGFFNLEEKEVKGVYLLPKVAQKGVGRMIVSKLELIARKNNVPELSLNATLNAEGFYQKCGYSKVHDALFELTESCKIPCIHMTKKLE